MWAGCATVILGLEHSARTTCVQSLAERLPLFFEGKFWSTPQTPRRRSQNDTNEAFSWDREHSGKANLSKVGKFSRIVKHIRRVGICTATSEFLISSTGQQLRSRINTHMSILFRQLQGACSSKVAISDKKMSITQLIYIGRIKRWNIFVIKTIPFNGGQLISRI